MTWLQVRFWLFVCVWVVVLILVFPRSGEWEIRHGRLTMRHLPCIRSREFRWWRRYCGWRWQNRPGW